MVHSESVLHIKSHHQEHANICCSSHILSKLYFALSKRQSPMKDFYTIHVNLSLVLAITNSDMLP